MSLINEALKRAEADKLNRSSYFDNLTVLPASPDAGPPPPPLPPELPPESMIHPQQKPHSRAVTTLMLAGGFLACLAASAWYVWHEGGSPTTPRNAVAENDHDAQTASGASSRSPGTQGPGTPGVPASAAPSPGPPSKETEAALARTMLAVNTVGPRVLNPSHAPRQDPNEASTPARHGGRLDANQPTTTPAPRPSQPPAAYVDISQFKLSGIVCGPDENVAIINDRPVRTGNLVNGARILRIERDRVDLKIAGREFSLQL
jgi:hypothetical protein